VVVSGARGGWQPVTQGEKEEALVKGMRSKGNKKRRNSKVALPSSKGSRHWVNLL